MRGTPPGSRVARCGLSRVVADQYDRSQLAWRHRQARRASRLVLRPPRSSARRMAATSGHSVVPRISARASSREGASLFSEAHDPVSVRSRILCLVMSRPVLAFGVALRHSRRAARLAVNLGGNGPTSHTGSGGQQGACGAIEQRDAADEGRLDAYGSTIIGQPHRGRW